MKNLIIFLFLIFFHFQSNSQQRDEDLVKFIEKWESVPYRFGGKTMKGIDCSKLTQKLYREVYKIEIPGVSWEQWNFSDRIPKDSLQTGDLVFFKSRRSPSGWHVGLYLDNGYFFHAANKNEGVKISSLFEDVYIKEYKGAGRIKKDLIIK